MRVWKLARFGAVMCCLLIVLFCCSHIFRSAAVFYFPYFFSCSCLVDFIFDFVNSEVGRGCVNLGLE